MKYEIVRLDGRFSHRDLFEYCIKFSGRMSNGQGPLEFSRAQRWFFETYGWSAEIRQWVDIRAWNGINNRYLKSGNTDLPEVCNPHWSWTNGYDDLRIYVASAAEITMFTLKFPVDQK